MPELLKKASCRKDWKRISAESSLTSPLTTQLVKGLNWTDHQHRMPMFYVKLLWQFVQDRCAWMPDCGGAFSSVSVLGKRSGSTEEKWDRESWVHHYLITKVLSVQFLFQAKEVAAQKRSEKETAGWIITWLQRCLQFSFCFRQWKWQHRREVRQRKLSGSLPDYKGAFSSVSVLGKRSGSTEEKWERESWAVFGISGLSLTVCFIRLRLSVSH